jgi:hypothetical protein
MRLLALHGVHAIACRKVGKSLLTLNVETSMAWHGRPEYLIRPWKLEIGIPSRAAAALEFFIENIGLQSSEVSCSGSGDFYTSVEL